MARKSLALLLMLAVLLGLPAQQPWCPPPSNRLVNDYSGMLSPSERESLEQRLVAFDDSTSNQIVVIITSSLHGCDIIEVGTRIGSSWGVGQKELRNGVVILIKSKSEEEPYGDVAILPGYGLEGALPDAFCKHIIDDEMIDPLSNGEYYTALTQALDVIEPVCRGEYSYADYKRRESREMLFGLLAFIAISAFITILLSRIAKKRGGGNNNSGTPFWGGMPGGGYWGGGFGSSGGGFGGGFGGFGGGSFGGGGAHGRF